MNPRILVPVAAILLLLAGCSAPAAGTNAGSSNAQPEETIEEVVAEPTDLTGHWTQTNSTVPDVHMVATITGEDITIEFINTTASVVTLFWAGTYVAPTEDTESYSWDSVGDVGQMSSSHLASTEPEKTFTLDGGVLKFQAFVLTSLLDVEMSRD